MQTIFPVLFSRRKKIALHRETFLLPDNDFLHLDWTINYNEEKPVILLLHGLEGSSQSPYIQRLMAKAVEQNFIAVCMHFRGCSGSANYKLNTYHAGETKDLEAILSAFSLRFRAAQKIYLVGFSLGGNVLLKWLAESKFGSRVSKAVAVSVPFDLASSANALHKGFSRIYEWWLIRCLKLSLKKKQKLFADHLFIYDDNKINSFWAFDHFITAKLNGFKDVHDYYQQSSSKQFLKYITTKTLIINAQDDPFLSKKSLPHAHEVSASVQLEFTNNGGHLGFVAGTLPFFPEYWIDDRIISYILED